MAGGRLIITRRKKGSMSDQGIFPLYIKGGLFEEEKKKGSVSLMIYIRACALQTSRARHHTNQQQRLSKKGNAHRR